MTILNDNTRPLRRHIGRIMVAAALSMMTTAWASAQASDAGSAVDNAQAIQGNRFDARHLVPTDLSININLGHGRGHSQGGRKQSGPQSRHDEHRYHDGQGRRYRSTERYGSKVYRHRNRSPQRLGSSYRHDSSQREGSSYRYGRR